MDVDDGERLQPAGKDDVAWGGFWLPISCIDCRALVGVRLEKGWGGGRADGWMEVEAQGGDWWIDRERRRHGLRERSQANWSGGMQERYTWPALIHGGKERERGQKGNQSH